MTSRLVLTCLVVGALGAAVTAAVYVSFSARVMPRLGHLPDTEAITTMQGFNRTAVQLPFMTAFFGAALTGAVLVVRFLVGSRDPGDGLAAVGGACYLEGFVLTIAYHVPLNDRLAALDPSSVISVPVWASSVSSWTRANTVRAALSVVATGCLVLAAFRRA